MAKGLTDRQRKILEYIIDYQTGKGFPPTLREIGDRFDIVTLRGVSVHLNALTRKGFMTRDRTSRSIQITGPDPRDPEGTRKPDRVIMLPLVVGFTKPELGLFGKIETLLDSANIEQYIGIPPEVAGPAIEDCFVIRVGANGVHQEPILPGDQLIVRPQTTAVTGELVAVLSRGSIAVIRYTLKMKANPHIELLGRIVGMMRQY